MRIAQKLALWRAGKRLSLHRHLGKPPLRKSLPPAPGLVSTRRVPLQVPAGLSSLVKIRQNIEPGGFSAKNQKKLAREPPARILSVILTTSEQSAAVRKPVRPPRQAAWPVRRASKTSLRGKPRYLLKPSDWKATPGSGPRQSPRRSSRSRWNPACTG